MRVACYGLRVTSCPSTSLRAGEEGKGSTFWFAVDLEKQPKGRKPERVLPEDIREARILVVDDHATNRLVFREMLRSWGCRFDEAEDGPKALDAAVTGRLLQYNNKVPVH